MALNSHADLWDVDLSTKVATLGTVQISFGMSAARGLSLAFIRCDNISLERQCLLAGEAIAAIETKLRWQM
jgi:hypothetical protein